MQDLQQPPRVAWARTLDVLQTRLAAARPALERALRHRAVASQTSTTAACCA